MLKYGERSDHSNHSVVDTNIKYRIGSKGYVFFSLNNIFDEIMKQQKLNLPDLNQPFEMHTDASDVGISAVLTQNDKLVRLYSAKLNESQKRYTTTEEEGYAIIKKLQAYRKIIFGNNVTIYTDSANFTSNVKATNSRVQRWKLLL